MPLIRRWVYTHSGPVSGIEQVAELIVSTLKFWQLFLVIHYRLTVFLS